MGSEADKREREHLSRMSWESREFFMRMYRLTGAKTCREVYGLDDRDRRVHGVQHTHTVRSDMDGMDCAR